MAEENARHVYLLEQRRRDQEALEVANLLRENEARAALEHQFRMQAQRDHLMRETQALARSLAQPVSQSVRMPPRATRQRSTIACLMAVC